MASKAYNISLVAMIVGLIGLTIFAFSLRWYDFTSPWEQLEQLGPDSLAAFKDLDALEIHKNPEEELPLNAAEEAFLFEYIPLTIIVNFFDGNQRFKALTESTHDSIRQSVYHQIDLANEACNNHWSYLPIGDDENPLQKTLTQLASLSDSLVIFELMMDGSLRYNFKPVTDGVEDERFQFRNALRIRLTREDEAMSTNAKIFSISGIRAFLTASQKCRENSD